MLLLVVGGGGACRANVRGCRNHNNNATTTTTPEKKRQQPRDALGWKEIKKIKKKERNTSSPSRSQEGWGGHVAHAPLECNGRSVLSSSSSSSSSSAVAASHVDQIGVVPRVALAGFAGAELLTALLCPLRRLPMVR